MKKLYVLFFSLISVLSFSQSVFWTENFGTGCNQGQFASGLNPTGNGTWSVTSTGTNQTYANEWFISATEAGMGVGNCGNGCLGSGGNNRTLHIGANVVPFSIVDPGAAYAAGSGFNTNKRVESPVINCSGRTSIILSFNYFVLGVAGSDYADIVYSPNGGSTWSTLATAAQIPTLSCSGQGLWTSYSVALPATADNNNNVKVGFRWQNVSANGADPSIAVDDITLAGQTASSFSVSFALTSTICAGSTTTVTANTGSVSASGYTWTAMPAGPVFASPNSSATAITFTSGGTYTISLTATSGTASASSSKTISVIQPTIFATGPSTSCQGSTMCLSASGPFVSYFWAGGCGFSSTLQNPCIPAPYGCGCTFSVVGTDANGCTNSASVCVTINPAPSLTVTSAPPSVMVCAGNSATLTASGASTYTWQPGSITGNSVVVTPTAGTTYSVAGTGTASCNGNSSIFIGVNPTPNVIASGPASVCRGDSLCLGASGALSYTWTGPCGFTGNQANVCTIGLPGCGCPFNVVGVDANGCTGQGSVCVVVNPLPIMNISSTDSILCSNFSQTATLTVSGAISYSWSTGANSSSIAVTPSTTTSYSVIGVNSAGCKSSATITQSTTICGGIDNVAGESKTVIFPNPVSDLLHFKFAPVTDNVILEMFDVIGKSIVKENITVDEHHLEFHSYPVGVYFIKITRKDSTYEIFRVIKQ